MTHRWISKEASRLILEVPHFRNSREVTLDANEAIAFYISWFTDPLLRAAPESVVDMGAGYGWMSIALALRSTSSVTPRIVAVEVDEARLNAAKRIAQIVGVSDRIEWCVASLGRLPFADCSFDTVICIEVVEHIAKSTAMMEDLARVTGKTLVITTPNLLFPIIHHDTGLPFCHWLPDRGRDVYAKLCGRSHRQEGNRFWSPYGLQKALPDFGRVSAFLHFGSWDEYAHANEQLPIHLRVAGLQQGWYRFVASLGRLSYYVLPTCGMTLRRQHDGLKADLRRRQSSRLHQQNGQSDAI
jgi:ubiquinone/menaquinone biosynthesis C-methylase UbiE